MSYRCSTCKKLHEGLPDIGFDRPYPLFSVPEEERDGRVKLDTDTCIIDDQEFYIRGVLEIPLVDQSGPFGIGVWVSQKKENFYTYVDNPDSDQIGPFFGWLCCRLDWYPVDTFLLKTMAHFRGGGLRPNIELEPTDHPLAVDQRQGITLARAWEVVHYCMRSNPSGWA